MHATWRPAAEALVRDLQSVFGARLRSVVVYGPHIDGATNAPLASLALVDRLSVGDLDGCAGLEPRWERGGVAIPLVLPEDEFRRSFDAFPLEYGEMIRTHVIAFGTDPFEGANLSIGDLRRACETQIKSHLIHLREGYIVAARRPDRVADLMKGSAPAFAALLRSVARLTGSAARGRTEATREGARAAGLSEEVVSDILALEHQTSVSPADPARLFPGYLAAVEQLARVVDTWPGQT